MKESRFWAINNNNPYSCREIRNTCMQWFRWTDWHLDQGFSPSCFAPSMVWALSMSICGMRCSCRRGAKEDFQFLRMERHVSVLRHHITTESMIKHIIISLQVVQTANILNCVSGDSSSHHPVLPYPLIVQNSIITWLNRQTLVGIGIYELHFCLIEFPRSVHTSL